MFESIKSVLFIAPLLGRHADDMFLCLLRVNLFQTTPFQQSKALQQTALSLFIRCVLNHFATTKVTPHFVSVALHCGNVLLGKCTILQVDELEHKTQHPHDPEIRLHWVAGTNYN